MSSSTTPTVAPEATCRATGGIPFLNVAATCHATRALGPGLRAVVWVQGCPFRCPGCIAPDWIPLTPAREVRPDDLAEDLCRREDLAGVTFSGGEPMLQAAGLAALARIARERYGLTIICFTGFTYEALLRHPPGPGVAELLALTDVLIDGQYIADHDDNCGMRGSSNQRVHLLSGKISAADYPFAEGARRVEIQLHRDYTLLVGVPPAGFAGTLDATLAQGAGQAPQPLEDSL